MYVRIPVPRISPGLLTNLLGVVGLITIVFAVASLTSWKWGLLTAGLFAVTLTVIAQVQESQPTPAGATVTPIAAAPKSRISLTAEAQLAAERARAEAAG
jgi:hypothetical protein